MGNNYSRWYSDARYLIYVRACSFLSVLIATDHGYDDGACTEDAENEAGDDDDDDDDDDEGGDDDADDEVDGDDEDENDDEAAGDDEGEDEGG